MTMRGQDSVAVLRYYLAERCEHPEDGAAFREAIAALQYQQDGAQGGEAVKPAECANGCPPFQVCDYCQSRPAIAPQPGWPAVDDAMVERALRGWVAHKHNCRGTTLEGSLRKALEAALAAPPAEVKP